MPDYAIPVLHPVVVHFPIAFLLAAAATALVWLVRNTLFWRGTTLLLLLLGVAGAGLAYYSGEEMAAQSEGVPVVDALVEYHEAAATWTLWLGVAALLAVGVLHVAALRGVTAHSAWRGGAVLLVLAAGVLAAWTSHLGGLMVWGVPN